MNQNDMQQMHVGRELSALERLTVRQLRERYAEVFGESAPVQGVLGEIAARKRFNIFSIEQRKC